jgi:hypothetical protein
LADVPLRPRNPWQIYLRENLANYKKDTGQIDTQTAAKELGKKWKTMGDADKKVSVSNQPSFMSFQHDQIGLC